MGGRTGGEMILDLSWDKGSKGTGNFSEKIKKKEKAERKEEGMHVGISVSHDGQLSQTQLHRFFSDVDFCSAIFLSCNCTVQFCTFVHLYAHNPLHIDCPKNRARMASSDVGD